MNEYNEIDNVKKLGEFMENSEELAYTVVVNVEEQYSIWPSFKKVPEGWSEVGFTGKKQDCLSHIKEIWKDMRPLSLRKKMEEQKNSWNERRKQAISTQPTICPEASSTVEFLTKGVQSISAKLAGHGVASFHNSLVREYIHLTFTGTRGQTCIGIKIDPQKTEFKNVDFEKGVGLVKVEGNFILDFVKLKCCAEIDLQDLSGTAQLEIVQKLSPFEALSTQ